MTVKGKAADLASPSSSLLITPPGFDKTVESIKHGAETAVGRYRARSQQT